MRAAASAMASIPEAQFRCTVMAGTRDGTPAHSADTRAGFAASAGITTLPRITSSSRSLGQCARYSVSWKATLARSATCVSRSGPPIFTNGVRAPATIATRGVDAFHATITPPPPL